MDDLQYFGQKTCWSIKWYNLMIINIVILLFYALILPIPYTTYTIMFFTVSWLNWLFYVVKYLKLREKKDELESINK